MRPTVLLIVAAALTLTQVAQARSGTAHSGYDGCGEYLLRGKWRAEPSARYRFAYVLHEGTASQLILEVDNEADFALIGGQLGQETQLTAAILSPLDGTRGVIREVRDVRVRFPDPLAPAKAGLFRLKSLPCLATGR